MTKEKPLLLLFDGNALVHRAFHALPPLTVSKTGEMVNAVRGFAATLLKVSKETEPAYWAIAFDRPTPTFRHERFAQYKAQRPEAPAELASQMEQAFQGKDLVTIITDPPITSNLNACHLCKRVQYLFSQH